MCLRADLSPCAALCSARLAAGTLPAPASPQGVKGRHAKHTVVLPGGEQVRAARGQALAVGESCNALEECGCCLIRPPRLPWPAGRTRGGAGCEQDGPCHAGGRTWAPAYRWSAASERSSARHAPPDPRLTPPHPRPHPTLHAHLLPPCPALVSGTADAAGGAGQLGAAAPRGRAARAVSLFDGAGRQMGCPAARA